MSDRETTTPTFTDFHILSETEGMPISEEAASMMSTRYLMASEMARGCRTLELGCASGPGLGLLTRAATLTVGADIDSVMLDRARRHYGARVPLVRLSAESLPFADGSFDFVLLLEASYYVPDFPKALAEIDRVLAPGGQMLLVSANPERADFIRSPFSHRYYSADEFRDLLSERGFGVEVLAGFPLEDSRSRIAAARTRAISVARRMAERMHMVPRTLAGRAMLKRLIGQRLRPVPAEIGESFARREQLAIRPRGTIKDHKVIYLRATRRDRARPERDSGKPGTLISVVIPCYNEVAHIDECLDSVTAFELPAGDSLEVLVVDGSSVDGTVDRIRARCSADSRIRLLHNPQRFAPHGLNIGIAKARGDFVARLDAHSVYPKDYLATCLETIRRTGADNVGGLCETLARGDGLGARVARALTTHRFGIGDSGFRTARPEGPADTVPYGFFRREVFERVGTFDERLVRAQDYELNRRIAHHNGRVWLNPNIRLAYYQQPTLLGFLHKQIALEAPYNAYLWYLAPYAFAARHAITPIFAIGVFGGIILSPFFPGVRAIFLGILVLYTVLAISASLSQSRRYRDPVLAVVLPFGFLAFHLMHGLGVIWGLLRLGTRTAPVMKAHATSPIESGS